MAYQALYRQWRPHTFGDIVGQEHVTKTLANAIASNRIAHAYLFAGPRGTGKTSTARILAKSVNCADGPTPTPCGVCSTCQGISNGSAMDVLEIDAASNNGVDEIRDLREKVKYSPTNCRYKVYIIDEVHMLSTAAFNALLKTLEEPPSHAIFILATTEVHKIPATILSRCQRFDFHRISLGKIADLLTQIADGVGVRIEEDALRLIARAADGALRDGISILDQCLSYSSDMISLEDVANLLGTVGDSVFWQVIESIREDSLAEGLKVVEQLYGQGRDFEQLTVDFLRYLRQLLQLAVGIDNVEFIQVQKGEALEQAQSLGKDKILHVIHVMNNARNEMRYARDTRIVFEMALLESAFAVGKTLHELAIRVDRLEQQVLDGPIAMVKPRTATVQRPSEKAETSVEVGSEESVTTCMPEATEESAKADFGITLIQRKWALILEKVRSKNVIVHALLKEGEPVELDDNRLVLRFSNEFHCSQITKTEKSATVVQVLKELFERELRLVGRVYGADSTSAKEDKATTGSDKVPEDDALQRALSIFGGQIIEKEAKQ